jgi:hypothetical protein
LSTASIEAEKRGSDLLPVLKGGASIICKPGNAIRRLLWRWGGYVCRYFLTRFVPQA